MNEYSDGERVAGEIAQLTDVLAKCLSSADITKGPDKGYANIVDAAEKIADGLVQIADAIDGLAEAVELLRPAGGGERK